MAREISDIHSEIGEAYIAQADVQTAYDLSTTDVAKGYTNLFSKVSIERLFFYAVAYCIYIFEKILDTFEDEIQTKVDDAFVANKAWWHTQTAAFQKGYNLTIDESTFKYGYATTDEDAQIIKRVAVRETVSEVCTVQLLVATEGDNGIKALSAADQALLKTYADTIKPAGVLVEVISGEADTVDLSATINYNPLVMNSAGELIIDSTKPVEDAINDYINNLNDNNFGGKLNITHLIDAIQEATGVVDVKMTALTIAGTAESENWGTYSSTNGWFSVGTLTLTYQPQTDI